MRSFDKVDVENVRYREGEMTVKTKRADNYQLELRNHYEFEDKKKLEEVAKSVDRWLSEIYDIAGRKKVRRPFVADIDTSSDSVTDIRVSIKSSRIPESIHDHIDSEFSSSTSVRRKQ